MEANISTKIQKNKITESEQNILPLSPRHYGSAIIFGMTVKSSKIITLPTVYLRDDGNDEPHKIEDNNFHTVLLVSFIYDYCWWNDLPSSASSYVCNFITW